MDTVNRSDIHITIVHHSRTALSRAVFGVRAQLEQEQQQEQQQMLPAQRFLEVGTG